jgi:hypothetical protein
MGDGRLAKALATCSVGFTWNVVPPVLTELESGTARRRPQLFRKSLPQQGVGVEESPWALGSVPS